MESSRPDLFIDMVPDRFIFKSNPITLSPGSTFIPGTGIGNYLKQELVLTVLHCEFEGVLHLFCFALRSS